MSAEARRCRRGLDGPLRPGSGGRSSVSYPQQWGFYDRARGVTGNIDLEMSDNIASWQRRFAKGFDTLRVQAGVYTPHLDAAIAKGYGTGDAIPVADDLATVGPYKIITDGSLGSRTAHCHAPYPGTNDYGLFYYTPDTLAEMIEKGATNGFRLAIHAIGDKANHLTLKTLDDVSRHHAIPAGSSIEHAQLLDPAELPFSPARSHRLDPAITSRRRCGAVSYFLADNGAARLRLSLDCGCWYPNPTGQRLPDCTARSMGCYSSCHRTHRRHEGYLSSGTSDRYADGLCSFDCRGYLVVREADVADRQAGNTRRRRCGRLYSGV